VATNTVRFAVEPGVFKRQSKRAGRRGGFFLFIGRSSMMCRSGNCSGWPGDSPLTPTCYRTAVKSRRVPGFPGVLGSSGVPSALFPPPDPRATAGPPRALGPPPRKNHAKAQQLGPPPSCCPWFWGGATARPPRALGQSGGSRPQTRLAGGLPPPAPPRKSTVNTPSFKQYF
jgi:hypothetical protein